MGVIRPNSDTKRASVTSLTRTFDENDDEYEREAEYELDDPAPDDAEIAASLAPYEFDLFSDYGNKHAKLGDLPKYEVYKNSTMLQTMYHPCSWEIIQEEFGGGHYKIIMKSSVKGTYVKSQTRDIADPPKKKNEEATANNKMFDLMNQMNLTVQENQIRMEERSLEERNQFQNDIKDQQEQVKAESQNQNNTMLAMVTALMNKPQDTSSKDMMTVMQSQSQQNMQMMLAVMTDGKKDNSGSEVMQMMMTMNQNTMTMIKDMNESNTRMFEKFSDKIEAMKSKDTGMDSIKLFELLQNAQTQGFDQMKLLNELADEKASEKSGSDDSDDSLLKTTIKSLGPALMQIGASNLGGGNPAPVQAPIQNPQQNPSQQNRTVPQQRNQRPQNQTQTQVEGQSNTGGRGTRRKNAKGQVNGTKRPKLQTIDVAQNSDSVILGKQKKETLDILIPFIGECLMASKTPEVSAQESIAKIIELGVDPKVIIPTFSATELIKIASGFGFSESEYAGINAWLEGFYESIYKLTTPQDG